MTLVCLKVVGYTRTTTLRSFKDQNMILKSPPARKKSSRRLEAVVTEGLACLARGRASKQDLAKGERVMDSRSGHRTSREEVPIMRLASLDSRGRLPQMRIALTRRKMKAAGQVGHRAASREVKNLALVTLHLEKARLASAAPIR